MVGKPGLISMLNFETKTMSKSGFNVNEV